MSKIAEVCKELMEAEQAFVAAQMEEAAADENVRKAVQARKDVGKRKEAAITRMNTAKGKLLEAV